jgi:hypothetical protein
MDPELRAKLEDNAEHFRGCPKERFDANREPLDVYEHHEATTPFRPDEPDPRKRGGIGVWVTRCLVCGGHRVTFPEGMTEEADDGEEGNQGAGA